MKTQVVFGQGVVSILIGGEVVLKMFSGENQDRASEVADRVKVLEKSPGVMELVALADACGFGSRHSLFVQARKFGSQVELYYLRCHEDDELTDRYHSIKVFDDPQANPFNRGKTAEAAKAS